MSLRRKKETNCYNFSSKNGGWWNLWMAQTTRTLSMNSYFLKQLCAFCSLEETSITTSGSRWDVYWSPQSSSHCFKNSPVKKVIIWLKVHSASGLSRYGKSLGMDSMTSFGSTHSHLRAFKCLTHVKTNKWLWFVFTVTKYKYALQQLCVTTHG